MFDSAVQTGQTGPPASIATSNAIVLPNVPGVVSEFMGKDGTRTLTVDAKGATWKDKRDRDHTGTCALTCGMVGRR